MHKKWTLFIVAILLFGCATAANRNDAAHQIARTGGFGQFFIKTNGFTLTAYERVTAPGAPVHLYIEGDGMAWFSRVWRSDNPTPRTPLVLELAALDPAANVVYLARPGQYAAPDDPPVDPSYWSDKRYAPEVVNAISNAIDILKARNGVRKIHLIGYSGGAAIAVLIAAQRNDVASLRTVAGSLDPEALNRYHQVSPLAGSLDPLKAADRLHGLPQRHFVGSEDTVIPPFIARSFVTRAGSPDGREITLVNGTGHTTGWREHWQLLLNLPLLAPSSVPR
ncbi:MAG: hypothetical protein PHN75_08900 [Syntrophales bacterium]|nr:hypothetical protein [Syntrophales bacterium]